jgi:hypothetical protein
MMKVDVHGNVGEFMRWLGTTQATGGLHCTEQAGRACMSGSLPTCQMVATA